jgi:HEAT repeat protein
MEESARNSTLRWLLPAAAVLVLVAAVLFGYPLLFGGLPPPEKLESTALDASVAPEKRASAALRLSEHGAKARPQMRKLLAESKDSDVRAAAVQGLMNHGDWSDMPQMMASLEDPSDWVRGRAAQAAWRLLGHKFDFNPKGTEAERAAAIKKIKRHYEWQDNYRKFHHEAPDAMKMPAP